MFVFEEKNLATNYSKYNSKINMSSGGSRLV